MELTSTNGPFGLAKRDPLSREGGRSRFSASYLTGHTGGGSSPRFRARRRASASPNAASSQRSECGSWAREDLEQRARLRAARQLEQVSGDYGGRATPDPIPNSVVKPSSA